MTRREVSDVGGRYYEEFAVGAVYRHETTRTITETDNIIFTTLSMNPQPLHLDYEFARTMPLGQPLVNSIFTLALAVGLSVADTTLGTTVGNLGFEHVEFPKPVLVGDTLHVETEVLDKRVSSSHPEWGIVTFEHRAWNQRREMVTRCRRAAMVLRKVEGQ